MLWLTGVSAHAAPDTLSKALTAVKNGTPECSACLFFGVPIEGEEANELIREHRLFSVSTLDLIPSPIWTVAVSPKEETFLLEARDLTAWNQMIREEKLNLTSEKQLTLFARGFLRLTSPRSLYLPSLTTTEQERVASAETGTYQRGIRIVTSEERTGLSFYAKNLSGNLELWSLIIERNGQIIKAEHKVFR